ncbi:Valerianol synthase TPS8 [Heracleum sosnowskyi]|uniref:Valerianol synthase TPS8 n=1 Tax=Heracleum sosnowskyi TaxID=360622 RepID=A0AAD8HV89_9APIA|nr:Valerianol synthase TPS8 [Heracleum sosnowskyi]
MTSSAQMLVASVNDPARPLAGFCPSLWGKRFSTFTTDEELKDKYSKEIELLKEEVSTMLVAAPGTKPEEQLKLINTIERLGLSYHFRNQIEHQLEIMFQADDDDENYDLFTEALRFRIFRQHGYRISCNVFNKFKDDSTGKFSEALASDPLGMLSLYDATFLRGHGEDVLEEALAFTTCHLKSMVSTSSSFVAKQITRALSQSLHRGVLRLEARYYISVYEEDLMRNEKLLRFAKLDFNLLMMIHKLELCELTRWYDELDLTTKLPYVRHRIVENHLWGVSIFFEPCYSRGRIIHAKMVTLLVISDDTYDAYGTFEELGLYTNAIEGFDISYMDQLPDYMKICYKTLLDTIEEYNEEMLQQGRLYNITYLKEAFKVMARVYYTEAKWLNRKFVAPFEEYLANATVSTGLYMCCFATFMGLSSEDATVEACSWAKGFPTIINSLNLVGRLQNDIVNYEEEKQRNHVATSIYCYMKEHGGTKEEAVAELERRIENAWKDANESLMKPTPVSTEVLMRPLNMMRMIDVTYKYADGYTHPDFLKKHVEAMFIDTMPV